MNQNLRNRVEDVLNFWADWITARDLPNNRCTPDLFNNRIVWNRHYMFMSYVSVELYRPEDDDLFSFRVYFGQSWTTFNNKIFNDFTFKTVEKNKEEIIRQIFFWFTNMENLSKGFDEKIEKATTQ